MPTDRPTKSPTDGPTASPTDGPTASPMSDTVSPTTSPTDGPTASPTDRPTASPMSDPTVSPTTSPTDGPTASPTDGPTASPTDEAGGPTPAPLQCAIAIEDTHVRENRPDNNYGSVDRFDTKQVTGDNRHTFLKFDVSAISMPVSSAILRLWGYTSGAGRSVDTAIYALDSNSWSAATATWNLPGATIIGNSLVNAASPEVQSVPVDFDVTGYINANLQASEISFGVVAESGTSVYKYYSIDAAVGLTPVLEIDSLTTCPAGSPTVAPVGPPTFPPSTLVV